MLSAKQSGMFNEIHLQPSLLCIHSLANRYYVPRVYVFEYKTTETMRNQFIRNQEQSVQYYCPAKNSFTVKNKIQFSLK